MNNEFLQNNSTEDLKKEEVLNNPEVINNESNESLEDSTIESREEVENFAEEKIDSLNKEAEEGLEVSENEKDAILNLGGDLNKLEDLAKSTNIEIENVKKNAIISIMELVKTRFKNLFNKKTDFTNSLSKEVEEIKDAKINNLKNEETPHINNTNEEQKINNDEEVISKEDEIEEIFTEECSFEKFKNPLKRKSFYMKDGIGFGEYVNPESNSVDLYLAAFGCHDFLSYMRKYEDDKPTNRFISKHERLTKKQGVTKTMIEELQKMLPEEHEYAEDTSISIDGLDWFIGQLKQEYDILKDENGHVVTTEVALNGAAKENPLGLESEGFEEIRIVKRKDFKRIKEMLVGYLEQLGAENFNIEWKTKNNNYPTATFELPVLKKKLKNKEEPIINKQENAEEKYNPNRLGSLLSIFKDLPTSPDKVYRSVRGRAAVDDIEKSGVVRNARSAGVAGSKCNGDSVYWCYGEDGKFTGVGEDCFVIEAPRSIAKERVVRKEDITAIYTKNESGEVFDILK